MNKVVSFPNEQVIVEQAASWIVRLDKGLVGDEMAELQTWLQDTGHRNALFEVAQLWDRMDVLNEIAELFPLQRRRFSTVWLYAASAVCVLVLSAMVMSRWTSFGREVYRASAAALFGPEQLDTIYRTAIGKQQSARLPDGSVVTLNTDTQLQVHYTATDRKLELLQGEASFEVAKGDARIFTVWVGENQFKAVGTAFNIRVNSAHEVKLMVTEGKVKVVVPPIQEMAGVASNASNGAATEIMIDAGKEVAIANAMQTVERVTPDKIEAVTAWKRGMIVFDGEPLERAIGEVSRYSSINFTLADNIKQMPVSGYFKIGDVDGLVAILAANFDIEVVRNGELIALSAHR
ncbi:MAG: FecR domain-containing protein [Steroidobacteraceae bacterium]